MCVKYRIAVIGGDHFPQVKIKRFLFWGKWKRIAKHASGYGLYSLPDFDYPKTKSECEKIINAFDTWFKNQQKTVVNIPYKPGRA